MSIPNAADTISIICYTCLLYGIASDIRLSRNKEKRFFIHDQTLKVVEKLIIKYSFNSSSSVCKLSVLGYIFHGLNNCQLPS